MWYDKEISVCKITKAECIEAIKNEYKFEIDCTKCKIYWDWKNKKQSLGSEQKLQKYNLLGEPYMDEDTIEPDDFDIIEPHDPLIFFLGCVKWHIKDNWNDFKRKVGGDKYDKSRRKHQERLDFRRNLSISIIYFWVGNCDWHYCCGYFVVVLLDECINSVGGLN